MASWKMSYGINLKDKGPDKLKCMMTEKGGHGMQLVMGGNIPEDAGDPAEAIELVKRMAEELDGLDASLPANHVAYLVAVRDFCDAMVDVIEDE